MKVEDIEIEVVCMEPWQERLADEYNEQYNRLIALTKFVESPKFDGIGDGERADLRAQRVAMLAYLSILDSRIARFQ